MFGVSLMPINSTIIFFRQVFFVGFYIFSKTPNCLSIYMKKMYHNYWVFPHFWLAGTATSINSGLGNIKPPISSA